MHWGRWAATSGVMMTIGLATSGPAEACGGLFCATGPTPQPVDQSAERIVFEVDEGRISAHVQISYTGGSDAFAWVVPVPDVPTVEESSDAFINSLVSASQLTVTPPPALPCDFGGVQDGGGGCGCAQADSASPRAAGGGGSGGGGGDKTVIIYDQSFTRNYEYVVLGAEQTSELVRWLGDNGYNVSQNMTPVMDPYNGPGAKFLALKLRDGRSTANIVPIKMSYPGDRPMIPIKLTAVAAQPLMGIVAIVLADRPYRPANYQELVVNADEILTDWTGRTSYFEWVAREAAEADGRAMVIEYVGPPPVPQSNPRLSVMSRFYTRLSPEHMTLDPEFEPHPSRIFQRAARLDLSAQPAVMECGSPIPDRQPGPCAFNYCGPGALCYEREGSAACACPAGAVASQILGPDGQSHVTCVPRENPFAVTATAGGAGTPMDPCLQVSCGEGTCVLKGGFPMCECAEGAVAAPSAGGSVVVCAMPPSGAVALGPGAGNEARPSSQTRSLRAARERGADLRGLWLLGGLLALAAAARRPRRA